jgi:hypothetical protein
MPKREPDRAEKGKAGAEEDEPTLPAIEIIEQGMRASEPYGDA